MAFDSLTEKLQNAFDSLKGKGKITEEDVNFALRQVRTALLEADVNFMVAKDFIKSVKEKALGEEVFGSIEAVKTVSDLLLPIEGEILEVNSELEDSPELVNSDPYGKGWLVKIKPANADDVEGLLSADDYKALIAG